MCGCNVKIGEAQDVPAGVAGIPLKGVMSNNIASLLQWAWCINPDKVAAAFKASTGLDITADDLITLSQANINGNDKKLYNVNFVDVVKGIKFTQEERDNSVCKIILTT